MTEYSPNFLPGGLAEYRLMLVLTAVLREDKGKIVKENSCEISTEGQMQDMTHEEKLLLWLPLVANHSPFNQQIVEAAFLLRDECQHSKWPHYTYCNVYQDKKL